MEIAETAENYKSFPLRTLRAPCPILQKMPTSLTDAVTMLKRSVILSLGIAVSGCLPATEKDFQMVQTITDMSDAVNEIRQLSYDLQDRVDSLVMVVARRDTTIRQLANLAGVSMPP